jgi:hypothetical protein
VLAALADAPYYFLTDSGFAWEQIVTFITAAFVYCLYVAYAEEVAVEAERGADRITAGGVLHELRQAGLESSGASAPKMTITTLISMLNGVRAYRKEKFPPLVFGQVLNAHKLEPQSAYAVEDSVEV